MSKREAVKIGKFGSLLGLSKLFLVMGPYLLSETMGMIIVVYMLQHSLDKGKYRNTFQFESARNLKSTYSNIWHASR